MRSNNYLIGLLSCFLLLIPAAAGAAGHEDPARITSEYGQRGVRFRENRGQLTDTRGRQVPFVLYSAAAPGMTAYVTERGLTYVFSGTESGAAAIAWIDLELAGAAIRRENVVAEYPSGHTAGFYYEHCPGGITVREYGKLTVRDVYPGIDWVLYNSSETGMKHDFIVHPGADPSRIRLLYESEQPLVLDEAGSIRIETRFGSLTEQAPVSFDAAGAPVGSAFSSKRLDSFTTEITYRIGAYPKDQVLTIDPQLEWGTRFGADGSENLLSVAHDSNGNVLITGDSFSPAFPVLDAGTYFQGNLSGTTFDAVILKFSNDGVLLWSTYYGGGMLDSGRSVACDAAGNIFVTGITASPGFPLQNGGGYFQAPSGNAFSDIFLLKFDSAGNRLWATCYGGTFADQANGIACDAAGSVFVTGYTTSADLPLQNAGTYFQPFAGGIDAFLLKFGNGGNRFWATYYGGSGTDIAHSVSCDAAGNVYAAGYTLSGDLPTEDAGGYFQGTSGGGEDLFLLKLDNAGERLWASYYGGSGDDQALTVAAAADGTLFATGLTASGNFPVQDAGTYFKNWLGGGDDAFVLKFDDATNRTWATYFGGSSLESPVFTAPSLDNIALDHCGNVYISLVTRSGDIWAVSPNPAGYCDGSYSGVGSVAEPDVMLLRFSLNGALDWATYIGDSEYNHLAALEVNSENALFMAGVWGNPPPTGTLLADPGNGAYFDPVVHANQDGCILKFTDDPPAYTTSFEDAGCLCLGSASVTVTTGFAPYDYTWSSGSQETGTTNPTSAIAGLCPGDYSVEVKVCGHAPDTLYFTIAAGTPPAISLTASDTVICAGDCIDFAVPGFENADFSWSFGDGTTSALPGVRHCYDSTGSYTVSVSVTDSAGCTGSDTLGAAIVVNPSPEAVIHADPTVVTMNDPTIAFTSLSTGATSWHWSFGDVPAGESTLPSVSHTYAQPGNYRVELAVSNDFQCTDTARTFVTVREEFAFFVPNAFTPQGDGLNELWRPAGVGIDPSVYRLSVFNRWGECVWSTDRWGEGWDGRNAGDGVYTWTATVKPVYEMAREMNGCVTVVR